MPILSSNGNLHLDTSLDVDDDLLDDLGRGVETKRYIVKLCKFPWICQEANILDQALVNLHLIAIPGLGTLTARSLTGGDLERLGRKADGALDAEVLGLGALNQLVAHLLKSSHLARGQGDADTVGFLIKSHVSRPPSSLRSICC
jgi:hypothetical protein